MADVSIYDHDCTRCVLHENARHVCMPGRGSWTAPGMVIGEAPGKQEDEQGKPFVGQAGELLRAMLRDVGLVPDEDVFITNANKCRPTLPDFSKNLKPGPNQIEACRVYLAKEVELLQPRAILLCGGNAVEAFIPRPGAPTITDARNRNLPSPRVCPTAIVTATWHPSYVLHRGGYGSEAAKEMRADLETFARHVKEG